VLGEVASEIAEIIKRDKTLLLVAACPLVGRARRRIAYIPERAEDDHWIVRALGRDSADQLCAVFGGNTVELGHGDSIWRAWRKARAIALVQRGVPKADAAREAGISLRSLNAELRWRV
jgi:hypothetical protein